LTPKDFLSPEARGQSFGYTCNRCLACCRHKSIQVNPYELAQLARGLGISTEEVRRRHTQEEQGVVLSQADDGACVFLGPAGCTVHPFRPLVCRLYPLGRVVGPESKEEFISVEPHPQSKGVYHQEGTIAQFLEAQNTAPFIRAADEYFLWFCQATDRLGEVEGEGDSAANALALLDIDSALSAFCGRANLPEPTDLEERKALHLKILYGALDEETEE
jgi:Fe-S-cluster containining protein